MVRLALSHVLFCRLCKLKRWRREQANFELFYVVSFGSCYVILTKSVANDAAFCVIVQKKEKKLILIKFLCSKSGYFQV